MDQDRHLPKEKGRAWIRIGPRLVTRATHSPRWPGMHGRLGCPPPHAEEVGGGPSCRAAIPPEIATKKSRINSGEPVPRRREGGLSPTQHDAREKRSAAPTAPHSNQTTSPRLPDKWGKPQKAFSSRRVSPHPGPYVSGGPVRPASEAR